jgi:hypothetical protein
MSPFTLEIVKGMVAHILGYMYWYTWWRHLLIFKSYYSGNQMAVDYVGQGRQVTISSSFDLYKSVVRGSTYKLYSNKSATFFKTKYLWNHQSSCVFHVFIVLVPIMAINYVNTNSVCGLGMSTKTS